VEIGVASTKAFTTQLVALFLLSVCLAKIRRRISKKDEMFLPITTIARVKDLDEAMREANSVNYGLTSGFYGSEDDIEWYFENIQAGVNYVNRPQGATTGAWPGFQPFGGWKGSGSTGKNGGGRYYLPQYMHEQIRTVVR
jgi:1-pyrroline-5-carboxylate dehydrogenase